MKLTLIIHCQERKLIRIFVNDIQKVQMHSSGKRICAMITIEHECNIKVVFENQVNIKEHVVCCFMDMLGGEFNCLSREHFKNNKITQISIDIESSRDDAILEFDSCGNIVKSTVLIKSINREEKEDEQVNMAIKRWIFFLLIIVGVGLTSYYGLAAIDMIKIGRWFSAIIVGSVVLLFDMAIIWIYRKYLKNR